METLILAFDLTLEILCKLIYTICNMLTEQHQRVLKLQSHPRLNVSSH